MGSHSRREIDRARALRAVKAPNGLNSQWVKIHRLTAVAPAGRNGQRDADVVGLEFVRAGGGFPEDERAGNQGRNQENP